MYAFNSAHVKWGVLNKYRTSVASSTGSVEDSTEPALNSMESLRIDLDVARPVALHMHRIDLFKCEIRRLNQALYVEFHMRRGTRLDLMHDDVKHCFCGSNVHCGSCSHARIQYGGVFPRSGKFKWQKC